MKEELQQIKKYGLELIEKAGDEKALSEVRVELLSKNGKLTSILRGMRDVPAEERPVVGALVNEVRDAIEGALKAREEGFANAKLAEKLKSEQIDITLPALQIPHGAPNILEHSIEEIEELFMSMGYDVVDGPELEEDHFNFELLNIPKGHPARDAQDTFYIENEKILLRSHTSPVQARTMLAAGGDKPIRMICPGKAYRRDADDATHSHQFMQVEGLFVDKNITLADMKGTLEVFFKKICGEDTVVRFRPSYYQFTEPSVEYDATCFVCKGKGCSLCKNTGWITIGGGGMVHPNVLRGCGYDPQTWTGFAFGFGLDRFVMLKYGINDIRKLYQSTDIREMTAFDRRDD